MKAEDLREVQRVLWAAADEMRANSSLAPAEYRGPVLGLVFLAYAEKRFDEVTPELQGKQRKRRRHYTRRLPESWGAVRARRG